MECSVPSFADSYLYVILWKIFLFNCKLFITGIKFQQNDIALGILIKLINKFEDSKTLFFTLKLTYK